MSRCAHRNADIKIWTEGLLTGTVRGGRLRLDDPDDRPLPITAYVECDDCGMSKKYNMDRAPNWLNDVVDQVP